MGTDRYEGHHRTTSQAALNAFSDAVEAVAGHRPDAATALQRALDADPDMVAAYALKGFGAMMLARQECTAAAAAQLTFALAAVERAGPPTQFETMLLHALDHAVAGRFRSATAVLDAGLEHTPTCLLAAKLAHGLRFLSGDNVGMLASTRSLLPRWSSDQPGYGYLLGCHAFALEETGDYAQAERIGRRAVLIEPRDAWGMHAVAHVYEMQARTSAGIGWLTNAEPSWQACHNFRFHMAWHLGLFMVEEGRHDEVLDLYDRAVRPQPTDDVRDVANATSLLWRLRQEGVDVGSRWSELAEIATSRRRETTLIFATLHQLLALVAAENRGAAAELLEALSQEAASGTSDQAEVAGKVGLPLARLIAGKVAAVASSALLEMSARLGDLGGSHAQRDVFLRTVIQHAAEDGDTELLQRLLDLRHQWKRIDRFATSILPARLAPPPVPLRQH